MLTKLCDAKSIEEKKRATELKQRCLGEEEAAAEAGSEEWRKNADTHKMSPKNVKAAGVEASKRPPGHNPGELLHQRRRLPYSYTALALAGLAITFAVGYVVLYAKKQPEATASDVGKVATGTAKPEDTRPRKYIALCAK
ncbi:hypothetical protein Ancab_031803 [Ancistrocladus abbreviatus]